MQCRNLGPVHVEGSHITIHKCLGGMGICTLEDSGRKKTDGTALAFCHAKCPGFVSWPTVSVVVTCHNYGRFLPFAIESVLSQTVRPSELIVVDDGSTDETVKVCDKFCPGELTYLRVDVGSPYLARKAGLEKATGEFVIFLDADDKLAPTYLEECLDAFDGKPDLGICTALLQQFGSETGVLRFPVRDINQGNWIANASMIRRSALIASDAFGRTEFDNDIPEDWYVWRKVINAGFKAVRIEHPLIWYRRHDGSRWDNLHKMRPYYDLAGLKYEEVTVVDTADVRTGGGIKRHGEYIVFCDTGNNPTDGEIRELLRGFWIDTAGVTGKGFSIVRQSVLSEFPTNDPTSDEWKTTVVNAGYKWSPELNPVAPSSHPRLPFIGVLVTPVLTFGGAEQWVKQLATRCDRDKLQWRVVMTESNPTDWCEATVGPIKELCPIYCVNEVIPGAKSFPDAKSAIQAAADGADVLVTWGHPQFWPLDIEIPAVMVSHSDHWFVKQLNDEAFGHATHFAGVSGLVNRNTTTPEMNAVAIWNGADESRLVVTKDQKAVRLSWGVGDGWWYPEKIFVGSISRVAIEKNISSIVRGVAELPRQFEFTMIGSGPAEQEIKSLGESLLGDRFHHVPAVDDIGNHLNAMDVFVMTSAYEGGPIAIFEAMLAGVPVVTTRVGSIPEIEAEAGEKLFWSVPDHPTNQEVAVAIREAYQAGRNSDRVKAAKSFAEKHLTVGRFVSKWTDYLLGIVNEERPKRRVGETKTARFCYFTGTNRANEKPLIECMLKSARSAGVQEDFRLFAPFPVDGCIHHPIDVDRSWNMHMAKIEFLRELKGYEQYDYFVWLDTDNYFVRHPGDFKELIRDEKCWVSMESDLTSPDVKFPDWYLLMFQATDGNPSIHEVYKSFGVHGPGCYLTNGGMFIVRRDAIDEFADKAFEVFDRLHGLGFNKIPDEPPLAIAGDLLVSDPGLNTFDHHSHIWAADWDHAWSDKPKERKHTRNYLPDGSPWKQTDWLTGKDLGLINPAIVHLMRGKGLMNGGKPFAWQAPPAPAAKVVRAAVRDGGLSEVQVTAKRQRMARAAQLRKVKLVSAGAMPKLVVSSPAQFVEPVGDKLKEILSEMAIEPPANCDCRRWITAMNGWGIEGCKTHRTEILKHLRTASRQTGWIQFAKVAAHGYFTTAALLDEAIKRAGAVSVAPGAPVLSELSD